MKLYKFLKEMDLRHSDQFDDYKYINILYVEDDDSEKVPITLRAILRFADCYVNAVNIDIYDNKPILDIIITKQKHDEPSIELLRYKQHLCR